MEAVRGAKPALVALFAVISCGGGSTGGGGEDTSIASGHPPRQAPPAFAVGGFSIELPATTIAPGEELQPCFIFPLAVTGSSHMVGGGKLTVGKGMHHGNIVSRKSTAKQGEGIRPCPQEDSPALIGGEGFDFVNGGSVLFASSTQVVGTEWQTFPDGDAFPIKEGYEIVARMHYLNVGDQPITVAPKYEWFTIDESKVQHRLTPFVWTYRDFKIPAQSEKTVTGTCRFPPGMHVVSAMPHMHQKGRSFTAAFLGGKLDGKRFLESTGYDPEKGVIMHYEPAIDLSQGEGATFSCTWRNPLSKEIGEGIGDNEMCILMGYAWPPEATYTTLTSDSGGCIYAVAPSN